MRVHDRPPPAVSGPRPGPGAPGAEWPADLFVAIERTTIDADAWDDMTAVWDDPGGAYLWDDPAAITTDHVDATCWLHGLTIEVGAPDPEGRLAAGQLALTLDNRDGYWSAYDAYGRLVEYLPGREVAVWAELEGEPWWLFAGEVTRWVEAADGTVAVEAFDAFSRLNQHIGEWTPGAPGQTVAARLEAICDLIGFEGPRRFDAGEVTLLAPASTRTPLEEMQTVAQSDGGVLGVDADGTLLYRDRSWPGGRADQTTIPVLSDNVCGAPVIVWELALATADDAMVNTVTLANVAEPPVTVTALNEGSRTLYGPLTPADQRTAELWSSAAEGQRLAEFLVTRRADASLSIESVTLHLHDPAQELWAVGLDRRLGDVLELLHDQPAAGGATRLDLFLALQAIRHEITPGGWVTTWATTRTVGNRVAERWDLSLYAWDDPDPRNVWGY